MRNDGLTKTMNSEGAIGRHKIVAHGTGAYGVKQAAATTESLLGISTIIPGEDGGRVDVILEGIAEVEYGASVTKGKPLTTDADGNAVEAAPAAGANVPIIGYAMVSGADGDIGSVHIQRSVMQGA
jgi:hypothetical protein